MSQDNTLETDEEVDLEEQEFLAQVGRDEEQQENEMRAKDAVQEAINHGADPRNPN